MVNRLKQVKPRHTDISPVSRYEITALQAKWARSWWTTVPAGLCVLASIWCGTQAELGLASSSVVWMGAWFSVSLLASLLSQRFLVPGLLVGLLGLLVGWRLAGPAGILPVIVPASIGLAAYIARIADVIWHDLQRTSPPALTPGQWQLALLRIYVAFDMVPHFTEKLFAGPVAFQHDVTILGHYGVASPELCVVIGGLCELAIALGLGLGLLTRAAAAGAVLYFVSTSLIGHHFSRGFIWNLNGGGWEYPLLMVAIFSGFAINGGGRFTVEQGLLQAGVIPKFLQRWCSP